MDRDIRRKEILNRIKTEMRKASRDAMNQTERRAHLQDSHGPASAQLLGQQVSGPTKEILVLVCRHPAAVPSKLEICILLMQACLGRANRRAGRKTWPHWPAAIMHWSSKPGDRANYVLRKRLARRAECMIWTLAMLVRYMILCTTMSRLCGACQNLGRLSTKFS